MPKIKGQIPEPGCISKWTKARWGMAWERVGSREVLGVSFCLLSLLHCRALVLARGIKLSSNHSHQDHVKFNAELSLVHIMSLVT